MFQYGPARMFVGGIIESRIFISVFAMLLPHVLPRNPLLSAKGAGKVFIVLSA